MQDRLNISFIVPCFNCEATLLESVESIFEGNYNQGDEVIFVDDASTDGTASLIGAFYKQYPGVVTIQHNINKGSAGASRNTAIDVAKHNWIFCLDADNILMPGSVDALQQFALQFNLDAAAFGEIRYFKTHKEAVVETWFMRQELDFIDTLNHPQKTPCGSGNYLFTKQAWIKAGRYNESLGGALDSEIFGLNLLATGAKFHTLSGTGYYHRYGYDSTFMKDICKLNDSLTIVAGIVRHLDLIDDKIVDYMLGSGRTNWRHNTVKRPILPAMPHNPRSIIAKLKRRLSSLVERI